VQPQCEVLTFTLGPVQTNCFIAVDDAHRTCVVIDPAWEGERLAQEITQRALKLESILITHAHFDHIGGCAALLARHPAPIYLHAADQPLWSVDGGASYFGLDIDPLPPANTSLEDGQHVRCGALDFEVLHLPGHTPGHVGLLEAMQGWLFSGDVLFAGSIGRTDLPGGDYATLMNSIRMRLLTLPDSTIVYSGHGPETTIGRERRSNPFLNEGWG
jgi:glyoxylase-like metal-dependent hydrolase (beta-lactamase superfamily II)